MMKLITACFAVILFLGTSARVLAEEKLGEEIGELIGLEREMLATIKKDHPKMKVVVKTSRVLIPKVNNELEGHVEHNKTTDRKNATGEKVEKDVETVTKPTTLTPQTKKKSFLWDFLLGRRKGKKKCGNKHVTAATPTGLIITAPSTRKPNTHRILKRLAELLNTTTTVSPTTTKDNRSLVEQSQPSYPGSYKGFSPSYGTSSNTTTITTTASTTHAPSQPESTTQSIISKLDDFNVDDDSDYLEDGFSQDAAVQNHIQLKMKAMNNTTKGGGAAGHKAMTKTGQAALGNSGGSNVPKSASIPVHQRVIRATNCEEKCQDLEEAKTARGRRSMWIFKGFPVKSKNALIKKLAKVCKCYKGRSLRGKYGGKRRKSCGLRRKLRKQRQKMKRKKFNKKMKWKKPSGMKRKNNLKMKKKFNKKMKLKSKKSRGKKGRKGKPSSKMIKKKFNKKMKFKKPIGKKLRKGKQKSKKNKKKNNKKMKFKKPSGKKLRKGKQKSKKNKRKNNKKMKSKKLKQGKSKKNGSKKKMTVTKHFIIDTKHHVPPKHQSKERWLNIEEYY